MKYLYIPALSLVLGFSLLIGNVARVKAAPTNENKGTQNPQVVAYYPQGVAYYPQGNHTVIQPDNSIKYGQIGTDLVLEAGEDKTFQQWYEGNNGD